jgi:ADP-heptose:LPS heptosyltransferase/SAM-dependent methyltransferase
MAEPDPARRVGAEARKTYADKLRDGFIEKYLSGAAILDIGYKGYEADVVPIVPQAIGIDLGYPGYDGRTLPVADNSQDAVFSSHCLEHVEDARSAIREWFRVLNTDGFLIIIVPHQYLYERSISPPSIWNRDHRRFYTTATLLIEIEDALEPNTYRVRHLADNDLGYDYSMPPDHHPGGCYEIELVIQKIAQPSWRIRTGSSSIAYDSPSIERDSPTLAPPAVLHSRGANHPIELRSGTVGAQPVLHDFRVDRPQRLLLLKLDHRGDFLIGLPALRKIRATFPIGHITLVCGSWNEATARDLGVADEIRTYDYFPENSQNWTGDAVEGIDHFCEVCKGQFDIAVDLRVDEDTRPLLRHVDAALRCGIGSRTRHPHLNIVLPSEFEARELRSVDDDTVMIAPDAFHSRMPIRTPFFHETDFSVTAAHLIYGPYTRLPAGRLRAEFAFQLVAPILWPAQVRITIEVARAGGSDIVARKQLKRVPKSGVTLIPVEFVNGDRTARYEFRVFVGGRPWHSRLRFFGVRVRLLEKEASGARYLPAELHIGEQLSLLVQLIAERVRPLYPPDLLDRMAGRPGIGPPALAGIPPLAKCIVVAPLSNSTVRDWPLDRYVNLIGMLLAKVECVVVLVGSRDQLTSLSHICHQHGGDRRLINLGGQIDWAELAGVLRRADLVIANNSGVAHLAAACGRPTLAIYSGSHQPQEWGPRGENVRAVTAAVSCSPCGYERLELCPHDHRCMKLIEPEDIFRDAVAMLTTSPVQTEGGLDLVLRS